MRTIRLVLLTALILVNLFGFYVVFIFKEADIKQAMAFNISNNLLTENTETLNFDNVAFSKLVFTDNGKEFSYNGRLFDVIEIKNSGSRVAVVVEYDAKETDLVETFASLFGQQQNQNQGSSPVKNFITHFQQDFVIAETKAVFANNNSFSACYGTNQIYPLSSFVADKLAPPPQFFLI